MRRTPLLLCLLAACGTLHAEAPSISGEASWASLPDPAALALSALPQGKLAPPLQRWQSLDPAAIAALRTHNAGATKRLQIGIERRLDEREGSATDWAWSSLGDGRRVAHLRVQSPQAAALRVAFELRGLPAGAELRFAGEGESQSVVEPVRGSAIAAQRHVQSLYWGPVTEGDTQLIEVRLPVGADERFLQLEVAALSHLLVSPFGSFDSAKVGESGACNVDVRCETTPSNFFTNATNSVARMIYEQGGSFLCTGTLLNDTDDSNQAPYLYSAAHCFTSQATASTLATFWFYEASACRSGQLEASTSRQITGGADVLFASEASDVLFLRLKEQPPGGAYYLGWNSGQITSNIEALVVHHPQGDVKKRSIARVLGIGSSALASGSFIKAGYSSGTTETGSSGAGLLSVASNGEFVLRGGLLGGEASCANATNAPGSSGNSDDYSRFDLAFPNLRGFLFPTSTTPPDGADFTGAWSSAQEDGWGLVVVRGSSGAYGMYIYHYDQDSTPGWYLSSGTVNGSMFAADLFGFNGPWYGIIPFNPSAVSNRDVGALSVDFISLTTANVEFTIDGRNVTTTLTRLNF